MMKSDSYPAQHASEKDPERPRDSGTPNSHRGTRMEKWGRRGEKMEHQPVGHPKSSAEVHSDFKMLTINGMKRQAYFVTKYFEI